MGFRAPSGWSLGWSRPSFVKPRKRKRLLSFVCAPSTMVASFTCPSLSNCCGSIGKVTRSTVGPQLPVYVVSMTFATGALIMQSLSTTSSLPTFTAQPKLLAMVRALLSAPWRAAALSPPDSLIAPRKSPFDPGATYCNSTSPPPLLCPRIATLSALPPNQCTSRCTQRSALCMSKMPQLPVDVLCCTSSWNAIQPSGPVR
mmetsp:Transcript_34542/g.63142  ORF Transcript_34542/g.63142 Transcript_34542/m.63142 type:complete len:201 (+) Transcript_34542:795-1397(+)